MNQSKSLVRSIYHNPRNKSSSWIFLLSILSLLFTLPAIAHDHSVVLFQPPPEDEQPESTEGAASRHLGECAVNSLPSQPVSNLRPNLTAIVPQDNYGLTTAEHPTFWVYLPESSAKQAILSIKEEGKSPHWQQSVNLNKQVGITGIELSKDAPALEVGKSYQWAIILVCGDLPSPNDPVVAAWIKRVQSASLNASSIGLEIASNYAQQGIWYDALDALIAEKSAHNDWENTWIEYLKSGDLDKVADEPIVGNLTLFE